MNTYEQLRDIIVKAVPEIMELKFGCRIGHIEFGEFVITNVKKKDEYWLTREQGYRDHFGKYLKHKGLVDIKSGYVHSDEVHILGRDITLEDVMIAVEKFTKKGLKSPNLKRKSELWQIQKIIDFWDFGKPLHKQSKEVHEFLLSVLNK